VQHQVAQVAMAQRARTATAAPAAQAIEAVAAATAAATAARAIEVARTAAAAARIVEIERPACVVVMAVDMVPRSTRAEDVTRSAGKAMEGRMHEIRYIGLDGGTIYRNRRPPQAPAAFNLLPAPRIQPPMPARKRPVS